MTKQLTREEILFNAISEAGGFRGTTMEIFIEMVNNSGDPDMYNGLKASFKAMLEYAEQQSTSFSEWMDIDCIRDGEHEWRYRGDNFSKQRTTKQLYAIFKKEQEK